MAIEAKICAIIVTYSPDPLHLERLISCVSPQVKAVIVVDNTSSYQAQEWMQNLPSNAALTYLSLGGNYGVGAAQNKGIDFAVKNGFSFILLLDQDSLPSHDMVEQLLLCHGSLEKNGHTIAGVGPRFVDVETGSFSSFPQYGLIRFRHSYCSEQSSEIVPAEFLISSGTLISLESISAIGPMDESLFIDLVDTEWFLRARSMGYSAFGVCSAVMSHNLGQKRMRVWLGGWRYVPYHSPLRHYYYFRNSVLLIKRNYISWRWCRNQLTELAYIFYLFLLTSPPRLRQMQMMFKGITDGLKGVSGKYGGHNE